MDGWLGIPNVLRSCRKPFPSPHKQAVQQMWGIKVQKIFVYPGGSFWHAKRRWGPKMDQTWRSGGKYFSLRQIPHLISILIVITPGQSLNSTFYKTGNRNQTRKSSSLVFAKKKNKKKPSQLVLFSLQFLHHQSSSFTPSRQNRELDCWKVGCRPAPSHRNQSK